MTKDIYQVIEDAFHQAVQIRRALHRRPELSGREAETEELICRELDAMGVEYRRHVAGHGIIATIYGRNRKTAVGIRADIDALPVEERTESPFKSEIPGVMHACGHDLHTATLLGTVRVLKAVENELEYSVRLFFEPAEETTGGAWPMIQAGCLKDPSVPFVIGLHNDPLLPCGTVQFIRGCMNAASTEFFVTVHGKACHGAHPHTGVDPLIPACEIVLALQSVITRRLDPAATALITVGEMHSGTKENIIPSETKMSGIIRVLDMDLRDYIKEQVATVCRGICESAGATCDVEFSDSYPTLTNDDRLLEITQSVAVRELGAENVSVSDHPSLGADDFSYFCQSSRGLYFNVGAQRPGDRKAAPLHSGTFDPDENCIHTGIVMEVFGVMEIMKAPEMANATKDNTANGTAGAADTTRESADGTAEAADTTKENTDGAKETRE